MEILIWERNPIGKSAFKVSNISPSNPVGWLQALHLDMSSPTMQITSNGTVRMVTYQKYDNVTLSPVTQGPTTPSLVLPPPPCPRQRRQGSKLTSHLTIQLSHPRNLSLVRITRTFILSLLRYLTLSEPADRRCPGTARC